MVFPKSIQSLVLVTLLATAWNANAQLVGSGTVSGVFDDVVSTQSSHNYQFPWYSFGPYLNPTSAGAHTNSYTWGLHYTTPPVYYLDGIETPFDAIQALGLTTAELSARATFLVTPSANSLQFTGSDFANLPRGQSFVAGHLRYSNGVAYVGTEVPSVKFDVTSQSLTPEFNQSSPLEIAIITTENVEDDDGNIIDPYASADFIYFKGHPELGSFRVFEGESTDVEILMAFNSLDLIGFGAVSNPAVGFVSPDITVPEPSTLVLAVVALAVTARRRPRRTTVESPMSWLSSSF